MQTADLCPFFVAFAADSPARFLPAGSPQGKSILPAVLSLIGWATGLKGHSAEKFASTGPSLAVPRGASRVPECMKEGLWKRHDLATGTVPSRQLGPPPGARIHFGTHSRGVALAQPRANCWHALRGAGMTWCWRRGWLYWGRGDPLLCVVGRCCHVLRILRVVGTGIDPAESSEAQRMGIRISAAPRLCARHFLFGIVTWRTLVNGWMHGFVIPQCRGSDLEGSQILSGPASTMVPGS